VALEVLKGRSTMTTISRIDVRIATASDAGSGTDGDVFVGVGGREFYIDSAQNDFEAGADDTYTLGEAANVLNSSRNDPRNPQLDTTDLNKFPVYVRFEQPGDTSEWHLERADVTVNPGSNQIRYSALAGSPDIWLGRKSGRFCYLERV
jgi:hypothetical protein